jgi:iron complex outermembrane receptor protein
MNINKNQKAWILMVLAAGANWAQAQSTPPVAVNVNAGISGGATDQLQDIVVTAQRRAEDVQHAALAIDVVTPLALSLEGATRASDLQNVVPALQISESGNGQQSLYVRGVGTLSAQSYSDPAVSFNVDGVSLGRTSSMTGVIYDLDRAEILKGPQGTLYGRNATGGAINIVPNQPQLGVTDGAAALTLGNYGDVHPDVYFNAAVTDSSAARLAMTYTKHDGYQTDGTGDADDYAGRAQYLVQFNDDLKVRLSADYAHDGGHDAGGTLIALQNPFTGAITASPYGRNVGNDDPRYGSLLAGQYSFISGRYFGPVEGALNNDDKFWGFMSEITWHNPLGSLTILPAYRSSSLNGLGNTFGYSQIVDEKDGQSSLELRLASEDTGLIRWIVGAYYFHESIDAIYQFNQEALAPIQDLNTGTLSKAGFGRLSIAPIENLRISAGLRYTDDRKTFDGTSKILLSACTVTAPIPACPSAPLMPTTSSFASESAQLGLFPIIPNTLYGSSLPGAADSVFPLYTIPINASQTFSKVTWHAGLEYDLAKESLLYANWDTGYHAGGFAFAEIKPTYLPEYVSAYSIGSKNRFLNDTLELNLEGFYWLYTNQQISHGGTDLNGAYVFYTNNAGSSTIKGGEISLKYLMTPHTVLSIDSQYLGAIYNDFSYQTPAGGTNAPPETGCPFSQTDATHYTVNCAGKTALQAPKWSGNVAIRQSIDLADYSLTGELSAHGQSASVIGFEMVPAEVQNAYAEGNASLTLAPTAGRWSVILFVNNFTDRRPYGSAYYNSVMGTFAASVGPPRIEGVRAAAKF